MTQVVDYYFQSKAKTDGKKTKGLETFQEQLEVIDLIPYKEQAHMLYESCTKMDSLQKEMEKIHALYLYQNIAEMANMENATGDQYSEKFIKGVLYDRNVIMTERIADMMKTQKSFFVIGAAHLGGKAGVLQLLIDKGYKLKQVAFTFEKGK